MTLTIDDTALAIASAEGAPLTRWDYSDIEMLPAPSDRLHLGLSNGSSARLDVRDPAFAQTVREHLGFGAPHHHASERRRRRLVIAWSAAATAAVLLIGIAGLPALAELALPLIPRSWEQELGPQQHQIAMSSFEEQGPFECGDEGTMERAGKAVFLKMFRRMEAAANLPIPLHPFVIRTAENGASTLPGGYIHINMGLILDTQTPDELAGIIAHELGHVANRDTLRGGPAHRRGGVSLRHGDRRRHRERRHPPRRTNAGLPVFARAGGCSRCLCCPIDEPTRRRLRIGLRTGSSACRRTGAVTSRGSFIRIRATPIGLRPSARRRAWQVPRHC